MIHESEVQTSEAKTAVAETAMAETAKAVATLLKEVTLQIAMVQVVTGATALLGQWSVLSDHLCPMGGRTRLGAVFPPLQSHPPSFVPGSPLLACWA